jgi:hypothetical protein
MTSVDTQQNRASREIPELPTFSGGVEIRYAVADLRSGAIALDSRR